MSIASELRRYFLLILVIYTQRDNPKVHKQLKASKRTKPWKEEMRSQKAGHANVQKAPDTEKWEDNYFLFNH